MLYVSALPAYGGGQQGAGHGHDSSFGQTGFQQNQAQHRNDQFEHQQGGGHSQVVGHGQDGGHGGHGGHGEHGEHGDHGGHGDHGHGSGHRRGGRGGH